MQRGMFIGICYPGCSATKSEIFGCITAEAGVRDTFDASGTFVCDLYERQCTIRLWFSDERNQTSQK
jgi:hypothetical protein